MTFQDIKNHIREGELNKALHALNDQSTKKKLTKAEKIKTELIHSEIVNYLGNHIESLEYAKRAFDGSLKINNSSLIVESQIAMIKVLISSGFLKKAEDEIFSCFDYINQKIKDSHKVRYVSYLYYCQGKIAYLMGELVAAEQFFGKTFNLFKNQDNQIGLAKVLLYLGDIHYYKGKLQFAFENYKRGLGIFDDMGYKRDVIIALSKISRVYQSEDHYEDAILNYLVALNKAKEIKDNLLASWILLNLIILLVDEHMLDKANEYFKQIQSICEKSKNPIIELRCKLAQGLILKNHTRVYYRMKAQDLFQGIVERDIIDYELSVLAMFNLLETLIYELSISGNNELLEITQALSSKLQAIAEKQGSFLLLAKINLLNSKLALLKFDIEKAKKFLASALYIARSNGLNNIAIIISNEYDLLLDQIKNWEGIIKENKSFRERIDAAQMENLFDFMLDFKIYSDKEITPELPILLLMISADGMSKYSFQFDESFETDDLLVSGFLSAISNFGKEIFKSTGPLERIKHKEFTILLKSIGNYTFSYIYKGKSYHAIQKLEDFMKTFAKDNLLEKVNNDLMYNSILEPETVVSLNTYAKQYFLKDS